MGTKSAADRPRARTGRLLLPCAVAAHFVCCPIALAQNLPPQPALAVVGEVRTPLKLDASELTRLPRRKVGTVDRQGRPLVYEGVDLEEVLRRAGAPLGEALKGKAMATYVLVEARDGYRAVFALAELDPAFGALEVLLADRRDGAPLDGVEGPLRLVVPREVRQARWVRQVRRIVLRQAALEPPAP